MSDIAIVTMRKRLLDTVRALMNGVEPPEARNPQAYRVRPIDTVLPAIAAVEGDPVRWPSGRSRRRFTRAWIGPQAVLAAPMAQGVSYGRDIVLFFDIVAEAIGNRDRTISARPAEIGQPGKRQLSAPKAIFVGGSDGAAVESAACFR